ncbi:MAG: hypothetical protein JNK72_06670 [Myxococcales bacterium]|nr:hypothetical protein [Myxococcales bacterium]
MSHAITAPLDSVSPRDLRRVTAAVFGLTGAMVFPLVGQVLGGPLWAPGPSAVLVGAGALLGGLLGRSTPVEEASKGRTLLGAVSLGAGVGAMGLLGALAVSDARVGQPVVMALFGCLYGAFAGLAMGVPAMWWLSTRREAIERPSVLARETLLLNAARAVVVVAVLGVALYSMSFVQALCLALGVGGLLSALAGVLRTARLPRLLDAVERGVLRHERAKSPEAPMLVWSAAPDHVLVTDVAGVDGGPFRGHVPSLAVARVSGDLQESRAAIGALVRRGLVTLVGLSLLAVLGLGFTATIGCARGLDASPCSGCDR